MRAYTRVTLSDHMISVLTIEEFQDIFALDPSELGCTKLVQHIIDTGDHSPIRLIPHRTLFALQNKTEELIRKILDQVIIKKSKSSWQVQLS